MFDLPKSILRKLLNVYLTQPTRLSPSEAEICRRIVICSFCDNIWVRRAKKVPDRCAKCHRRGWDRPLLELMRAQDAATTAQAARAHVDAPTSHGQPTVRPDDDREKGDTP